MNTSTLKLRLIHHWACSGGTLISKCIASLPGVILLNEVNPLAYLRLVRNPWQKNYCPTDICQQLAHKHNGKDPVLSMAAFTGAIEGLLDKTSQQGLDLVLRCHDHVDFFCGPLARDDFAVSEAMRQRASLLSLLTVRHPLDCWMSIIHSKWDAQISLSSLDEFCQRCLIMLNVAANMPMTYYENFVLEPTLQLKRITQILELSFCKAALETFSTIELSGDSGRHGNKIEPRQRHPVSSDLQLETSRSLSYSELCEKLGYDADPDAPYPYLADSHQPSSSSQRYS